MVCETLITLVCSNGYDAFVCGTIQLLRVGDIFLIAIPGELFFETGQAMTTSFPDVSVFVAGNTNDHLGYIIPAHVYEESNYESFMTLLEKGAAETFKDHVIHDVDEMLAGAS